MIILVIIIYFRWSDGTAANMLRWAPGEPNDAYHGQRCVNMYPNNGNSVILIINRSEVSK